LVFAFDEVFRFGADLVFAFVFDLAFDLVLAFDADLVLALAFVFDLALDADLVLAFVFELVFDADLALVFVFDLAFVFDFADDDLRVALFRAEEPRRVVARRGSSPSPSPSEPISFFATPTAAGIATPSAVPATTFCVVESPSSSFAMPPPCSTWRR
jgi:hypothetical protein